MEWLGFDLLRTCNVVVEHGIWLKVEKFRLCLLLRGMDSPIEQRSIYTLNSL